MHGMARFAAVVVRRAGELTPMDVRVTVLAGRPLDHKHSVHHGYGACSRCYRRHGGNVALHTGDVQVFALERIGSRGVFAHPENAGLKPVHRVTGRAVAPLAPRRELPLVRVRVAVQTTAEGQGLIEIRALVASRALHFGVLAQEWILRLGVVEYRPDLYLWNLFPGDRRVAGLTGGFERTVVRVGMAIGASAASNPYVTP